MPLSNVLGDYATGLITEATASAFGWLLKRFVATGVPVPLVLHRRELRDKVREMPFIYRDLEPGDVLNDYVDVDLGSFDLNTLRVVAETCSRADIVRRLRDRRKALLLGNPGIGKTTFIRHTILQLLRDPARVTYLPNAKYVPFYVPLKAVDPSGPFPILRYLLAHNLYLRSRRGLARLTRLARSARLFLFLDGFDEIYVEGGLSGKDTHFVKDELEILVGGKDPKPWLVSPPTGYFEFYDAARYCRVWLTSRREFFAQNRLDLAQVGDARRSYVDLVAISLLGVGNNRLLLARRIFDQYRERNALARDVL